MPNKIEKTIVLRSVVELEWGKVADLAVEEDYSVKEYTVLPSQAVKLIVKTICHYVIASGTAEISNKENTITLFKGEKVSFKDSTNLEIKNCGVIPLVFIEISLNYKN